MPAATRLTSEEIAFHAFYARERTALELACALHVARLQALLAQVPGLEIAKVEGRVKDRDECLRKFARKYRAALEEDGGGYEIRRCITDLIGVRVVCLYEDELGRIAQLVRQQFEVIDVTDKVGAVQGTESAFGYMGLHLDLRLKAELADAAPHTAHLCEPFELQVRTIIQDAWSVLDHRIKYKKSIPAALKRRINVLSALFELADREFRQIRDATEAELQRPGDDPAELEGTHGSGQEGSAAPRGSKVLDAFSFLRIARHFFPDQEFDAHRVDLFVDDILGWDPAITRERFNATLRQGLATVKRYKQAYEAAEPGRSFNPFTVIRHCLYLGDPETFQPALRNTARAAFQTWLQAEAS
ncbi:GTP pyrophosphokinase [Melaminivora alkalimesophila]|uniref:PpGpp synthetase/RelA/SpoT-type nucleotidyltransferase n=1 Tax=Melaminivora alkalimesophila TaxID=1165852 RepID=A0A317RAT0_9BURK|nr:hypothetical protein [Melaminivora alkalimesophila]PWW46326.1 ppGpp synthetase/RelA/SpoT-type nucleotidyltransferase [Melaminivora alkalimesophila]